jgi:hypothetical protein
MDINIEFVGVVNPVGKKTWKKYSRTALIRINWEVEPSGYAENPDNWTSLWKPATLTVCSSAVTIYSMYLRLKFSTTPDLKF